MLLKTTRACQPALPEFDDPATLSLFVRHRRSGSERQVRATGRSGNRNRISGNQRRDDRRNAVEGGS